MQVERASCVFPGVVNPRKGSGTDFGDPENECMHFKWPSFLDFS